MSKLMKDNCIAIKKYLIEQGVVDGNIVTLSLLQRAIGDKAGKSNQTVMSYMQLFGRQYAIKPAGPNKFKIDMSKM